MGLFGSKEKKNEPAYVKVENQLKLQTANGLDDEFDIRVVRIDGCQYLVGIAGYTYVRGISTIIHKADCDNPLHQLSEKTTPLNSNRAKAKEKISLDQLEEKAFPKDHPVSLNELRKYAYAEKYAETLQDLSEEDWRIWKHLRTCERCQEELNILKAIDPVLNGEDEKRVKVLIDSVKNS